MVKYSLFLILVFLLWKSCPVKAQSSIQENFERNQQFRYQEKVYLHTDKDYYMAEEKIWFRAYRVDAMNHLPQLYSKYINVELYNRQNKLIERVKVHETDSGFYGYMPLWKKLPLGEYCLKAYTNWMQNFDDAFYFRKNITIINPSDLKISHKATFRMSEDSTSILARIQILNDGEPFPQLFTTCFLKKGTETIKFLKAKTDKEGWMSIKIRQKDSIDNIQISFLDKKPFEYKCLFYVPEFNTDFDLQFMPEGGHWLCGTEQVIAFKAIAKDGRGVQVSGSIYNQNGEFVAPFTTVHLGMGKVALTAKPGESYYAAVNASDGQEKRFELPLPTENGITLQAEKHKGSLFLSVKATENFPFQDSLLLIAHSRGKLLATIPIAEQIITKLPEQDLPNGVLHCAIVHPTGKILSQRMLFINHENFPQLSVTTDKKKYKKREKVKVSLQLDTKNTIPASVSIAVTDDSRVLRDSSHNHIISYLLLSSDIKGFVENPNWYFDSQHPRHLRERYLDLVMLTQGWTRFDISKICKGRIDSTTYYVEVAQRISGKLKNLWGKECVGGTVCLIAPSAHILKKTTTDENGNFAFNHLVFPDSTLFTIQGLTKKRGKFTEIVLDNPVKKTPVTSMFRPYLQIQPQGTQRIENNRIFEHLKLDYYYENGQKIYLLEEATVTEKRSEFRYTDVLEGLIPDIVDQEELRAEHFQSVREWIMSISNRFEFRCAGDSNYILYMDSPIVLYINGVTNPVETIDFIEVGDIEKMAFVKAYDALRLPLSRRSYLMIYLKKGCVLDRSPRRADFFKYMPLGYQMPEKFYQPKYENPEVRKNLAVPDKRTTIYWNPYLRIEKDGKADFEFYTADRISPYTIIVEGITDDGQVFRQEAKLIR